eukprot:9430668-Pyramimonas_sp.AAC.1
MPSTCAVMPCAVMHIIRISRQYRVYVVVEVVRTKPANGESQLVSETSASKHTDSLRRTAKRPLASSQLRAIRDVTT